MKSIFRTKAIFLFVFLLFGVFSSFGEMINPVKWNFTFEKTGQSEGYVVLKATIESGWHMYSTKLPEGGPVPTSVHFETTDNAKSVGELTEYPTPHSEIDEVYNLKLSWWEGSATIKQKFQIDASKPYSITGYVQYMACNDGTCQAPQKESFVLKGQAVQEIETEEIDSVETTATAHLKQNESITAPAYWNPVSSTEENSSENRSLWYIFLGGFIGGLIALLTPCVWPMIPLTVSFFLKKHSSKHKAIVDALIYGFSIVAIYLTLGIVITLIFGPAKLNELSTNAIFNIVFFLLLVVFAVSFFGAFELSLPSKWTNKMDAKADRTSGILSIFFMAFTLALVSFSCTGPIIGTLLVEAVSLGDLTGPIVGMGAFALALAIPFAIFAIFPTWLQSLPKSGGWLNSVKVVLGFIELALSLKFLSVADLAYGWGILDREVFLVLWIVIFALLGFYLLGKIRLTSDSKVEKIGVTRLFLSIISLSFAVYLIPGLWGAPLRSVSAFVPPLSTQDFNLYSQDKNTVFDNYDEGVAASVVEGKPIFLEFSGYGCVNCRKMEMAVFDRDIVKDYLKDNFITISLMVDDRKELEKPIEVEENGKKIKLTTCGDLWSFLQRYKFKANSQPYYVVLDNQGNLLSGPTYYDESVQNFMKFLNGGLNNYKKQSHE